MSENWPEGSDPWVRFVVDDKAVRLSGPYPGEWLSADSVVVLTDWH